MLLSCHLCGDSLDILLSLDVDTGDSWQIDYGEIGSIIGVDPEFDGIVDDLSSFACDLIG